MNKFWLVLGIFLPLAGTVLGAGAVFFLRQSGMKQKMMTIMMGFTSGVMMAAAIWSLLIPALEMAERMGRMSFAPAAVGFCAGVFFLLFLDRIIPHIHTKTNQIEGPKSHLQKITMMVLAVALHNFPEGMAVGVVFSNCLSDGSDGMMAEAFLLSIGIAIQNIPEGAIVSLPLKGLGKSKKVAFGYGMLSGIVEPIGAVITILLVHQIQGLLPWLLAFAAGAMVFVIVEELVPESSGGKDSDMGTIGFALGFVLMMILDVTLG